MMKCVKVEIIINCGIKQPPQELIEAIQKLMPGKRILILLHYEERK